MRSNALVTATSIRRAILCALVVGSVVAPQSSVAATSPMQTGPRIVYTHDYDVWSMNPDGSGQRYLAHGLDPAVSPDGSRIAYERRGGGLWTMNTDGTERREVDWAGSNPAWSPDGRKIAYDRGGLIYMIDSLGATTPVALTSPYVSYVDTHPSWSPDGSTIVFQRSMGGQADIWSIPADGSGPAVDLTNTSGDYEFEVAPSWSPDGSMIAYVSSSFTMSPRITLMDPDGSNPRWLDAPATGDGDHDPAWSANGSTIVFDASRGTDDRIHTIGVDGSGERTLSPGFVDQSPSWQVPRELTLTATPHPLPFGPTMSLTAHLDIPTSNPTLTLYELNADNSTTQMAQGQADTAGDFTIPMGAADGTQVFAEWEGDASHPPARSGIVPMLIPPHLRRTLSGFYGTDGPYRLYHRGTRPIFRLSVSPDRSGARVRFRVQTRVGDGWEPVSSRTYQLDQDSVAGVRLLLHVDGTVFRIRGEYLPDQQFAFAKSGWKYFRLTR